MNEGRIPLENPGKSWEIPDLGSGGGLGEVFIVNLEKSVARKLCRSILLHCGLLTVRFHFGKLAKSHRFHDFLVFLDVSMTPQTNYS